MNDEFSDIKIEKIFKKLISSSDTPSALYHFALAYTLSSDAVRKILKPAAIKIIIYYKLL